MRQDNPSRHLSLELAHFLSCAVYVVPTHPPRLDPQTRDEQRCSFGAGPDNISPPHVCYYLHTTSTYVYSDAGPPTRFVHAFLFLIQPGGITQARNRPHFGATEQRNFMDEIRSELGSLQRGKIILNTVSGRFAKRLVTLCVYESVGLRFLLLEEKLAS